jgi:hypothetical protein
MLGAADNFATGGRELSSKPICVRPTSHRWPG